MRFAAAQVSGPREGGLGVAFSHLAGLELRATGGPWPELDASCVGRLTGGSVRFGGQRLQGLPLDFGCPGPATLELRFAHGTVLQAQTLALQLVVPPDARLTESLAC